MQLPWEFVCSTCTFNPSGDVCVSGKSTAQFSYHIYVCLGFPIFVLPQSCIDFTGHGNLITPSPLENQTTDYYTTLCEQSVQTTVSTVQQTIGTEVLSCTAVYRNQQEADPSHRCNPIEVWAACLASSSLLSSGGLRCYLLAFFTCLALGVTTEVSAAEHWWKCTGEIE